MKKTALFIALAASLVACTKWENRSTEYKVTGLWTGQNQQVDLQALPFFDSTYTTETTYLEANFMDDGSLIIDSAGVQVDSIGWSIKNDTILLLKGIDLGFEDPITGEPAVAPSNIEFDITKLEEDAFHYRFDTIVSVDVDPNFPAINLTLKQIQRWSK